MAPLEDVKCRLATAADYDDVMAINRDVYSGVDYLPVRYHEYIKEPHRYCFLAEHQGKVVGFTMRTIVDDVKTVQLQSARVSIHLQGRGVIKRLNIYARSYITHACAGLRQNVWTTVDEKTTAPDFLMKHPTYLFLSVRPRISIDMTSEELRRCATSSAFKELLNGSSSVLTTEEDKHTALNTLTKQLDPKTLIPEGMWVVDWEPFGPYPSNYTSILKESVFFVSRDHSTGKILAVSFLTNVQVKMGIRCRADFYCIPERMDDGTVILDHIIKHQEHILRKGFTCDSSYSVLYPDSYHSNHARGVIQDKLGFVKRSSWDNACLLFKEDISEDNTKHKL